ncbi:MAG: ribonuclease HI [Propionibacteriaceae bacterium]|nr:ribonuclease HI [Propionibacteriaceae bacterium]
MITAAADGSSLSNPGPAGWAWYIDDQRWAAGGWPHGTNNMGELMAVLDLLRQTRAAGQPLLVLCDSQYAINVCTTWLPAWKRRGWRKADKQPVQNLDLVQALDQELAGRPVEFQWVKGHAGHPLNEAADSRARAAAEAFQAGRRPPTGPGFDAAAPPAAAPPSQPVVAPPAAAPLAQSAQSAGLAALAAPTLWEAVPPPADPADPAGLVEPVEPVARPVDPVAEVCALERELLSDQTQLDRDRLNDLLGPAYVAHLPDGAIRTRGSVLARPAQLAGPVRLDLLGAEQLTDDLIGLRFHLDQGGQSYVGFALWQHDGPGWRVRFHQTTPIL